MSEDSKNSEVVEEVETPKEETPEERAKRLKDDSNK